MEITGKVHCFFEQSGTFKNEFKKLGYEAFDYDIQNNFGETDHVIDLFAEIEKVFMTDAGMNQKQLAEKIGISTPVMCDMLTNKRGFTTKQAKKYEEIFGVPAVIFLTMYNLKELEK